MTPRKPRTPSGLSLELPQETLEHGMSPSLGAPSRPICPRPLQGVPTPQPKLLLHQDEPWELPAAPEYSEGPGGCQNVTCDKIPKCSRTGNRFNLSISLPMAPDRLTAQTGWGPVRGYALIREAMH